MRIDLIVMAALVAVTCAEANTPAADPYVQTKIDAAFDRVTFGRLKTVKASVTWHEVDIAAALEEISHKIAKAEPGYQQIRFKLRILPGTDRTSYRRSVSIALTDVPVLDLLHYIENQTNFTALIHKNEVVLTPVSGVVIPTDGVR